MKGVWIFAILLTGHSTSPAPPAGFTDPHRGVAKLSQHAQMHGEPAPKGSSLSIGSSKSVLIPVRLRGVFWCLQFGNEVKSRCTVALPLDDIFAGNGMNDCMTTLQQVCQGYR